MYLTQELSNIKNYILNNSNVINNLKNKLLIETGLDASELKFKKCYYKDSDNAIKYIPEMSLLDAATISVFDGSFKRNMITKNDNGIIILIVLTQTVTNEVLIGREMYYSIISDTEVLGNTNLLSIEYETVTIGEIDYKYRDKDGNEIEVDSEGILTLLKKNTSINKYLNI